MSIQERGPATGIVPTERTTLGSSLAALRARFARDESGTVAMTFGLAFIPCMMMVGFAVDYGRVTLVKQNTQSVLDGAALAAARAYQSTNKADRKAAATKAAKDYWAAVNPNTATVSGTDVAAPFRGAMKHAIMDATVLAEPTYAAGDTELTMQVTQWIKTPFFSTGELLTSTSANVSGAPTGCTESKYRCVPITQKSTVKLMQGGSTDGETLEISVMVDVTGSMLWEPGKTTTLAQTDTRHKLSMLKKAAKAYVDIVLPETDEDNVTRMALVPFSQDVYLGSDMTTAVAPSLTGCTRNVVGCDTFNYQYWDKDDWEWKSTSKTRRTGCLAAREGTDRYTDVSPVTSPLTPLYETCATYNDNTSTNRLLALQNNPSVLKTAIDGLYAEGGTAGHVGTMWAWYTLSPNWSSIWGTAGTPKAYTETKNKKVAVLMTDGDYNHQHCKGVQEGRKVKKSETENEICDVPSSQTQAENVCAAMKTAGITVYTIAFDTSTDAQNFLKNKCATSAAHAYNANSEDSIMSAFQDIALKTSRVVVFK